MVKRLVAELPRKQVLCAGSESPTRALLKAFAPILLPIDVEVA